MVDNTIQLPQEIYEAVRQRAAAQRKTPDTLVIEWVSSHLEVDKQAAGGDLSAFEQEVAAFGSHEACFADTVSRTIRSDPSGQSCSQRG